VDPFQKSSARIIAKQKAVVAGAEIAAETFRRLDPELHVRQVTADGAHVENGDAVLEIAGATRSILTGERVALNFLQRLSGIATLTREFVSAIEGTRAQILDTRKTTPGLRQLEKAAVKAGGGVNHRIGLFDMAMVKDNHLAAKGDLEFLGERIQRLRRERPEIRIELEADTLDQLRDFLTLDGVAVILLDNMSLADLRKAVQLRGDKNVLLEASGGVTLATVAEIARTGVDFISAGALTHSAPAADFSLEIL
jgi:nicotinate-nucleotide pyrophosphorylase (carboxylating)